MWQSCMSEVNVDGGGCELLEQREERSGAVTQRCAINDAGEVGWFQVFPLTYDRIRSQTMLDKKGRESFTSQIQATVAGLGCSRWR